MRFVRQLACLLVPALIVLAGAVQAEGAAPRPAELAQCEAGDGAACLIAGQAVYLGMSGPADAGAAIELFRLGCALGSGEACLRLGHELEFPDTGAPDLGGAEAAYAEACVLGIAPACGEAGAGADEAEPGAPEPMLPPPPPEAGDAEESERRDAPILVAVPAPDSDAQEDELPASPFASEALPDLFFEEPETDPDTEDITEPDELTVLRSEHAADCASGQLAACELYAGMVQTGDGGEADPVRARRIYSVICTQGSILGCYELAWLFYDEGGDLAPGRARFLFSESCIAGLLEACLQAGDMRRSGEGGRRDEAGAALFYAIACEDGLEDACGLAEALLLTEPGDAPDNEETPDTDTGLERADDETETG
ncbi:MAG: tetratricopeptide repeat protein [Hyphomonas sp.]